MKVILTILLSVFRTVIIPAQFQDREFTHSEDEIARVVESARSYFDDQYNGKMSFQFDIAPIVTLPDGYAYYGANGETENDLHITDGISKACKMSAQYVDFSQYDNDGDGRVDVVVVLFAGPSEAESGADNDIMPQQNKISNHLLPIILNGCIINEYAAVTETGLSQELNGPGDLCHEICHILGLPDFYDTDGPATGGISSAMWKRTSLMDNGNRNNGGYTPPNFNCIERELLSIGQGEDVETGKYILEPVDKKGRFLKINCPEEGKFIMAECRKEEGWDSYIGGSGLLLYYLDRSETAQNRYWIGNRVNCDPANQCARIIEARKDAVSTAEIFFPQKDINSLSLGRYGINLAFTGISISPKGNVVFNVIEPFTRNEISVFQDAAILSWTLDESIADCKCHIEWKGEVGDSGSFDAGDGRSCTMENLRPRSKYSYTITAKRSDNAEFYLTGEFTTKALVAGLPPFINLSGAERDEDGNFTYGTPVPLRISNLVNSENVVWLFNGRIIETGPDGFYQIRQSGTLTAKVSYIDGSIDIISKEIRVR